MVVTNLTLVMDHSKVECGKGFR